MTAAERKWVITCLLVITVPLLWLSWYVSEHTYHSCEVPGVGEFSFAIKPSIVNIFIGNGGSTLKTIYWQKPDDSEISYGFGLDHHGYWQSTFSLVEQAGAPHGLLLESAGDDPVYLDFTTGTLSGVRPYAMERDGKSVFAIITEDIPSGILGIPHRKLSSGKPMLVADLFMLAFNLLWPFMLLAEAIAALWLTGILICIGWRRLKAKEV